MTSAIASAELVASLNSLHISSASAGLTPRGRGAVFDSWEEAAASHSDDDGTDDTELDSTTSPVAVPRKHSSAEGPLAPPPTPASLPTGDPRCGGGTTTTIDARSSTAATETPTRRPDKTTAAASRMIAAGLGMRPPRRTEDEIEYDRAMREKERKRRDKEKVEAARLAMEEEEAKKAIWDD